LLFDAGFQALVSIRCSPATACYSSSSNSITSKIYLVPCKGRIYRMKVLPTFRESSPRFKLLQEQDPTIWWTNTCPWHGGNTTLQLHCSTMLGACLLQSHGAIYSRSQASSSWQSDDSVTAWSWDLQTCARLKVMTLFPCLVMSFVTSASIMPEPTAESHGYNALLDPWVVCRFLDGKRISDHC
jgi:hypothetical protein